MKNRYDMEKNCHKKWLVGWSIDMIEWFWTSNKHNYIDWDKKNEFKGTPIGKTIGRRNKSLPIDWANVFVMCNR